MDIVRTSEMREIRAPRQIGAAIREARHEKGLTQQQLADSSGVSRGFINRLEKGESVAVYPEKLLSVLSALGLRLMIGEAVEDGVLESRPARVPLQSLMPKTMMSPMQDAAREFSKQAAKLTPNPISDIASAMGAIQANLNLPATSALFAARDLSSSDKGPSSEAGDEK